MRSRIRQMRFCFMIDGPSRVAQKACALEARRKFLQEQLFWREILFAKFLKIVANRKDRKNIFLL